MPIERKNQKKREKNGLPITFYLLYRVANQKYIRKYMFYYDWHQQV